MRVLHAIFATLVLPLALTVSAQPSAQRIRGDVVAIDGQKLTVQRVAASSLRIVLGDQYTVTAIVKSRTVGDRARKVRRHRDASATRWHAARTRSAGLS